MAIASAPGGSLSTLTQPISILKHTYSQQKLLDTMTWFVLWMVSFRRVSRGSSVGRAHPAKRVAVLRGTLEHNSDGTAREGVALPSKGHFALVNMDE